MLFTKTVLKPHHSVTLKLICDMWQKLLTQSKHTGISCMGQRLVLHIIILLHLSVLGLREHLVAPLILCRSICRPREVQQLCLAVKGRGGDSSFFLTTTVSYNLLALIFSVREKNGVISMNY